MRLISSGRSKRKKSISNVRKGNDADGGLDFRPPKKSTNERNFSAMNKEALGEGGDGSICSSFRDNITSMREWVPF